jgi:nickel-dependent lactate racemase
MTSTLRYGTDASLSLEFEPGALLAQCGVPDRVPLEEISPAIRAALAEPLEFPPLARATVPGDKIVLALEPGLPQAATLISALVDYLVEAGAAAADITILCTKADLDARGDDPRRLVAAELREKVQLRTHDPDHRDELRYLAATPKKGRPIYLNRSICDADLVVTVGCLRCEPALGYHGVNGTLYPTYSDTKSLQRFRNPNLIGASADLQTRARHEVDRIGWLAGTQFTVQVIPGPGDTLLEVLAGDTSAVFAYGQSQTNAAWSFEVPRRASLVLASVGGDAGQQTWDNVGRALAAALRVVADNGAIALCTELHGEPGPALRRLVDADDLEAAVRRIGKERAADALPAVELAEALRRAKIYLLSQLDESFVEEIGIAPINTPGEIVRLAHRHKNCIVLANAQFAIATPREE